LAKNEKYQQPADQRKTQQNEPAGAQKQSRSSSDYIIK
jgi:hypothetical protein